MGYSNFGRTKTIVLPNEGGSYTGKEYFEKYGIDLTQFFYVNKNKQMRLRPSYQNSLFLMKYSIASGLTPVIFKEETITDTDHVIKMIIMVPNEVTDIFELVWDESEPFDLENIHLNEI